MIELKKEFLVYKVKVCEYGLKWNIIVSAYFQWLVNQILILLLVKLSALCIYAWALIAVSK